MLKEIIEKGELQVGEKEREAALQKMRKEIASSLAAMSVNPTTLRPYPVTLIEKASIFADTKCVCVCVF